MASAKRPAVANTPAAGRPRASAAALVGHGATAQRSNAGTADIRVPPAGKPQTNGAATAPGKTAGAGRPAAAPAQPSYLLPPTAAPRQPARADAWSALSSSGPPCCHPPLFQPLS